MEHTHQHQPYGDVRHAHSTNAAKKESTLKLAISATIHCLIGCGIGEVAGMVVSTYYGLSMSASLMISILSGFVFGFALGIIPLLRKGLSLSRSLKLIIAGEGLSIAVMEAFEALTQTIIPGVMTATITDTIFWVGMAASLLVGFIAALPVNFYMIKRGVIHQH